jgi:hypothetical protein
MEQVSFVKAIDRNPGVRRRETASRGTSNFFRPRRVALQDLKQPFAGFDLSVIAVCEWVLERSNGAVVSKAKDRADSPFCRALRREKAQVLT